MGFLDVARNMKPRLWLWSLFAFGFVGIPQCFALTFSLEGVAGWPSQAHYNAAVSAASAAIDRYNDYGNFNNINSHVYIYYDAGIPTAQANFGGSVGFGGTYPAERVMMHEMAHFLGLPNWASGGWNGTGPGSMMEGGSWRGGIANQLVHQFDGDGATLRGDGAHFWPYGLNFDSEGSEINKQRQVAMVYAMRADLGIGPAAHPSNATTVTLTGDDPFGSSGFHYKDRWSDGYFAHAGAAYSTGDFMLRTPASSNGFRFAGDSLTINNTNGISGGLLYKGIGSSGVVTVNNLVLDGGYVRHANGSSDLFQLAGSVVVAGDPTIDAAQGHIKILAPISGAGSVKVRSNGYSVTLASVSNSYNGETVVESGTLLVNGATGYGLATIRSGAILAGGGHVRGSLTSEADGIVRVGGFGLSAGLPGGRKLVDDFEAYPAAQLGASPNSTGDAWLGVFNGTAYARIIDNSGDQALEVRGLNEPSNSWRGAVTDLAAAHSEDFSLPDGQTGTYFFRARRNGAGTIDSIFGVSELSAAAAPGADIASPWNEYGVTLSIFGDTDSSQLRANSGDSGFQNIRSANNAEWINVWLTIDNESKTYRVATSTGTDDGADSGSEYAFGRRTGPTVGGSPLVTFGIHEARNVAAEIDDLYFVEGRNLTNPLTQTPTLVGEKLTIGGDLQIAAGSTLAIDVAQDAWDTVEVAGTATLEGVLSVTVAPGYTPSLNDTFIVLSAANLANDLAIGGPHGFLFSLAASSETELVLTAVSGLAGDYNNDGAVDAADYTVWRDRLGAPAGSLFNDLEEVAVGDAQYLVWRSNFGMQLSSASVNGGAEVPEPSVCAIVILGIAALFMHRRRFDLKCVS